jgi:hypothetical protein
VGLRLTNEPPHSVVSLVVGGAAFQHGKIQVRSAPQRPRAPAPLFG